MKDKTKRILESMLNESVNGEILNEEEKSIYLKYLEYMLNRKEIADILEDTETPAELKKLVENE